MRVLMFGWEFPPHNTGGLGVACHGLIESLADQGHEITFVLPKEIETAASQARIVFAAPTTKSSTSHQTYTEYIQIPYGTTQHALTKTSRVDEILATYAARAGTIACEHPADVIHAHDWLSFPAGVAAKHATGTPLVLHVHLPSVMQGIDGHYDSRVYDIEYAAFIVSDAIIAVSHLVRDAIIEKYGVSPEKVFVVHNGVCCDCTDHSKLPMKRHDQLVALFMGRVTAHKGPDYFIRAAARVHSVLPDAIFMVAGEGEMLFPVIEQAARMGIGSQTLFVAARYTPEERKTLLHTADVLVMPSVAEPFGIVALEAACAGVPVIISKQSGVGEVLKGAIATDYWDVDATADALVAIAQSPALSRTLAQNAHKETTRLTWDKAASGCGAVYNKVVHA